MAQRRLSLPQYASLAVLALPLSAVSPANAQGVFPFEISAATDIVKADGLSSTILTARVFDRDGNAAPDGTRIRFTTTLGRLDNAVAATQNGVARVTLFAPNQSGEAVIVATLDGVGRSVPARITVSFQTDVANRRAEEEWLRINGTDYVGYVKDYQTIQANGRKGGATFAWRAVTISADTIQYNLTTGFLRAEGNVQVEVAGEVRNYDRIQYAYHQNVGILAPGTGVAERIEENRPKVFYLRGPAMTEAPWEEQRALPRADMWALTDLSGSGIAVVARSVAVSRNGSMQFRRATFYLDGKKTFSVPFHVMSTDQESIYQEQIIGFGQQGVSVDFPYYYDVRPQGIGTLRLRHGATLSDSAYSVRPGWWLDLVQEYNGRRETNGRVELLGLSRQDWGARFNHSQRLDKDTTGRLYLDFPFHRDIFARSQVSRDFKGFTVNMNLTARRNQGLIDPFTQRRGIAGGEIGGGATAESVSRPVLGVKRIHYSLNAAVNRQSYYGGGAVAQGTFNSQRLGTRFSMFPVTIGRGTTVAQTANLGQTWTQGGIGGNSGRIGGLSMLASTEVRQSLDRSGINVASLTYDYTQEPQLAGAGSVYSTAQHRMGLNLGLSTRDSRVSLNLNASQALDQKQSFINGRLNFRVDSHWAGQVYLYNSRFADLRYQEIQYSLIRSIAGRNFAIHYSTTTRRFQLDLSGARF